MYTSCGFQSNLQVQSTLAMAVTVDNEVNTKTRTLHSVPRSRTSALKSEVLHAVNEMVEAVVSRTTSVAVQAEALNHQMVLR